MSSSDLSELSSPLSSDREDTPDVPQKGSLDFYFKQQAKLPKKPCPPPRRKRTPSPPHEFVLADNPDVAFICMFRARFGDAFSKSIPHLGPQDIERGITEPQSTEQVERLLCALLGLVLNRKKEVERGHFSRALEEAIQTHSSQWPRAWEGKNPLRAGGPGDFHSMTPTERLVLLRTLILWSLSSSETIQAIIKESYKQQRHEDDLNQPLSVQPWGRDGDKRQFWLVEGQDDTHFRLYRESNPALKHNTWQSVAGNIEEVKQVADKLDKEETQAGRRLAERIRSAIPRFEAGEEKRRRRDYRQFRKAQFTRPEPGLSLYEGRTRGKRIRYTYSDEGEEDSDAISNRRSNRQSGISTPAEPTGPVITFSGRQVKSRLGGEYGESRLSNVHTNGALANGKSNEIPEDNEGSGGRTRSTGLRGGVNPSGRPKKHIDGYNDVDDMDEESDAAETENSWNSAENDDEVDEHVPDAVDDADDDMDVSGDDAQTSEDEIYGQQRSLVVTLRYPPRALTNGVSADENIRNVGVTNPRLIPVKEATIAHAAVPALSHTVALERDTEPAEKTLVSPPPPAGAEAVGGKILADADQSGTAHS